MFANIRSHGSSPPHLHRITTGRLRAAKVAVITAVILGLFPAMPAHASDFGLVPSFPTIQTVGQAPVTTSLWLVSASALPVTISEVLFVPSCSNWDTNCAGGTADPGTFSFSATGTGASKSACANQTFNLTVADPTTGQMRVRRADGQNVSLTRNDVASDLDECRINFTMKANRVPNHDSFPNLEGAQTNQNMAVYGSVIGGLLGWVTYTNNDITTVAPGAPSKQAIADFNGDGRSDVSIYRAATGIWYLKDAPAIDWGGGPSDIPVPADYDKNGRSNAAVYRKSAGTWLIQGMDPVGWGGDPSDIPVPGDYNKDGTPDVAVYRKATGIWYIKGMPAVNVGGDPSDVPVPADYDGDGDTDIAVYRASTGIWYFQGMPAVNYGGDRSDIPVPADYNKDGKADLAVYRRSTGIWYLKGMPALNLGGDPSDIPAPADYDGDGDADVAVYRKATGTWYIQGINPVGLGSEASDRPLTAPPSTL